MARGTKEGAVRGRYDKTRDFSLTESDKKRISNLLEMSFDKLLTIKGSKGAAYVETMAKSEDITPFIKKGEKVKEIDNVSRTIDNYVNFTKNPEGKATIEKLRFLTGLKGAKLKAFILMGTLTVQNKEAFNNLFYGMSESKVKQGKTRRELPDIILAEQLYKNAEKVNSAYQSDIKRTVQIMRNGGSEKIIEHMKKRTGNENWNDFFILTPRVYNKYEKDGKENYEVLTSDEIRKFYMKDDLEEGQMVYNIRDKSGVYQDAYVIVKDGEILDLVEDKESAWKGKRKKKSKKNKK